MGQQTVIYIHGAGAQRPGSESGLLLEKIKHELNDSSLFHAPSMPNPNSPDCQSWMEALDANVHKSAGPLILIGHSLGGSVILKYLSENIVETEIQHVLLLAVPFWGSQGWNISSYHLKNENIDQLLNFNNINFFHCLDDKVVPASHLKEHLNLIPHAEGQIFKTGDHYFTDCIGKIKKQIRQLNKIQISLNE